MPTNEKTYALLLLRELLEDAGAGPVEKSTLLLPLTLAYLLSGHIPVVLVAQEKVVPHVDRAYDEVLRGLPLQSRGVSYCTECSDAEVAARVAAATLVVTNDPRYRQLAADQQLPHALLLNANGKGPAVELSWLDKLADVNTQRELAGFAQLVNIQSGGFMSEGHFSLSW